MGFFRFRRSIKLFPGVRWNIGMKSSSLSFGGRGFHYTVGKSGTRTTVGIPGSGLSYTEFHGAHRRVAARHPAIPVPSESWIRSHMVTKTLHIPDRKPDEPPIRPDQLDQLSNLEHVTINGNDLKTMGCDQADTLLEQIRYQQKEVSKTLLKRFYADHGHAIPDAFINHCYDHPGKPWKEPKKHGCLILIGIFLLVGWFNSLSHKEEAATASSPASRQSSTSSPPACYVLPDPKYWPKEVRISAPVVLSGTVDGGMVRQTAKPGAVLDVTLSSDHKTVTLRRLDISGTLPIGDTDFIERARKAESGE